MGVYPHTETSPSYINGDTKYMEAIAHISVAGSTTINVATDGLGDDIEILWVRAYQTGTTAASYISIYDNQLVDVHASGDVNNKHLVFQASVGADWITANEWSYAQTLEWVFPKPILARNGAFILNGTGVVSVVGYRTIGTNTPYDNDDGDDPSQESMDKSFRMGDYIKGKRTSGVNTDYVLSTADTEVWGIYIMNTNEDDGKTVTLKNGDNQTIATLPVTKVIESDEGTDVPLRSSRFGPMNFDTPLIANKGLKITTESNTQFTYLYRLLGSEDAYPRPN